MMNGNHGVLGTKKSGGGGGLILSPGSGYITTSATTPPSLFQPKVGNVQADTGIKSKFNFLYLRTLAAILRILAVIVAVIVLICLGCVAHEYQPGHGFVDFTAAMALIVMLLVGCMYCFSLPFMMLGFSSLIWCSVLLVFNAIWVLFYFIGGIICIAGAEDNKDCIPAPGCRRSRDSYGAAVFFCWVAAIIHAVLAYLAFKAVSMIKQATITPVGTLQRPTVHTGQLEKYKNGSNGYDLNGRDNRGVLDKIGDKMFLGDNDTHKGYRNGYDTGGSRFGYIENGRNGYDSSRGNVLVYNGDNRGPDYGPRDNRGFLEKVGDKLGIGDRDDDRSDYDSRGNRIVYNTGQIRTGPNDRINGYSARDDRNFLEKVGDKIGFGDHDDDRRRDYDSRGYRIEQKDDRGILEKVGDKIGLGDRDDNRRDYESRDPRYQTKDDRGFLEKIGDKIGVGDNDDNRRGYDPRDPRYTPKDDRGFLEKVGDKIGIGDRDDNRGNFDSRRNQNYGPKDDRGFFEKVGDKIGLGDSDRDRRVYTDDELRTGYDVRGNRILPQASVGVRPGLDVHGNRIHYDTTGNRIIYDPTDDRSGRDYRAGPPPGYPGEMRAVPVLGRPRYEEVDNRGGARYYDDGRSSLPRRVSNSDGVASVAIG